MTEPLRVYIDNDNMLTLDGLANAATDAYVNNATVAVTVTDRDGNEIVGETWPLTLNYVAASNGTYRATLQDTLTLTHKEGLLLHITADGAGLQAAWELYAVALTRRL